MNKVILIGRLTKDPDIRYTQGQMAVGRYTLAVDRIKKGEADFISCLTFGKTAEFAEKYLKKGTKIAITGRIQTGSYKNREGQTVYTTDVVVDSHEFCESKTMESTAGNRVSKNTDPIESEDGFMIIPDGIEENLPFA